MDRIVTLSLSWMGLFFVRCTPTFSGNSRASPWQKLQTHLVHLSASWFSRWEDFRILPKRGKVKPRAEAIITSFIHTPDVSSCSGRQMPCGTHPQYIRKSFKSGQDTQEKGSSDWMAKPLSSLKNGDWDKFLGIRRDERLRLSYSSGNTGRKQVGNRIKKRITVSLNKLCVSCNTKSFSNIMVKVAQGSPVLQTWRSDSITVERTWGH